MLRISKGEFIDENNRIVTLRGVNFSADVKQPLHDSVRYINTPCSLEEADEHFQRIKACGFNCIRFLYVWDALQPNHPDEIDEEYIDFAIKMVKKAIKEYDLYVFMDPHQDIWSRFSGGSGAPKWTLHAAGFNPEFFEETQAAIMWNPDSEKKAMKMLWASNYHRLVCQTMFTLFFGGPEYTPKALINGVNVGTYLKDKFFYAIGHFMKRVNEADLGPKLLGWESINEPGHGLIGYEDLGKFPKSKHHVKLGTSPTPVQAMLLGQGIAQNVDCYKFTGFGIKRIEVSKRVAPKHSTWLNKEDLNLLDKEYGWTRSWEGGCLWELHGVYDSKTQKLLKPNYFKDIPEWSANTKTDQPALTRPTTETAGDINDDAESVHSTDKLDPTYKFSEVEGLHLFVDNFYVRHWKEFSDLVSSINVKWFQFMQAPVNAPPPQMKKHYPQYMASNRVVYTPHFYDGMTLMLKKWRWLNVDAISVMRELHSNPIAALKFGDNQIANGFVTQFRYLKREGRERLGANVPFLMSEIGIPYDMNNKNAYLTGYWDNQIRAMDANIRGLEKAHCNYTLWCYAINNTHKNGDLFQGEDLSIWSKDDFVPELEGRIENGLRAAVSVIRPGPEAVAGPVTYTDFNIRSAKYKVTIVPKYSNQSVFFLPYYHYPKDKTTKITVSQGTVTRTDNILVWTHGKMNEEQTLKVEGVPQWKDALYSYFEGLHHMFRALWRWMC